MARKINSSEQDNSEILAGSDSDLDTEIYTNSDNSTSDSDDPTSEPGDSTTHSDDSTADSDEKKKEPPSKKKRTEFLNWKHEKFVPKTFYFNNENAGITSDLKLGNDPIDYFELFFDQKIMEYIAEETNRYQQQNLSSSTASHTTQWYATNFQETGEQAYRNCESMTAIKWMDKREVYMLSTIHDSRMIAIDNIDRNTGKQIMKLVCVQNYNENMGTIDLVDMQSMINADGGDCGLPSYTCGSQGVAGCVRKCMTCGYRTGYCKRKFLFWQTCKCAM
ncbi:unnamed protein product [Rotaria sordida]|uniref:PiggyBac transposable element-derived protein domain-containing protein n=1 Tax=Rotaria sordida TaxID=392033 RepID=A0A814EY07_9BILA|nr:unnamed protein product [Rotaria sordida]CAF3931571.1 unnamed protein product [Rotaria sordida]